MIAVFFHSMRYRALSGLGMKTSFLPGLLLLATLGCSADEKQKPPQESQPSPATSQLPSLDAEKNYKTLQSLADQPAPIKLVSFLEGNRVAGADAQAEAAERLLAWRRSQCKDFTAEDLLNAAREAVPLSLQEGFALTDPVDQLGRTGGAIQQCLRYYPLKFSGDEGIEPLLAIMRDRTEKWHLRHYLISHIEYLSVPGKGSFETIHTLSNLASLAAVEFYLSSYAIRHQAKVLETMRPIASDSNDHPLVRAAAVEAVKKLTAFDI